MPPASTTIYAGRQAAAAVPRSTFFLLSVMCGISIASAYYAQPLLPTIGRALGATEVDMGLVPTMTQIGIGLGVALLMPLGDIVDTRKLVLVLVALHVLALAGVASAQSVGQLQGLSFALGATTVTPYLLPALAARLASASERGQVTGLLARGIFAGILLARTASWSAPCSVGGCPPFPGKRNCRMRRHCAPSGPCSHATPSCAGRR
jgi:MFS family permease